MGAVSGPLSWGTQLDGLCVVVAVRRLCWSASLPAFPM